MPVAYSKTAKIINEIKLKLTANSKILNLDEILILFPGKKEVKNIRGILKGKLKKSAVNLFI